MSRAPRRPRAAMILAAGRGERMRPLTDSIPKPLLRVRGQTLIERHVIGLARAGITRIIVNLHWLGEQIRDYLKAGEKWGVSIIYSEEQPRALETAGGILNALPHLAPGPFTVVNGDVFTDFPLATLSLPAGRLAHLVLVPNPSQHPRGDFGLLEDSAVESSATLHTFSGIAVYDTALFEGCSPGPLPLKPLLLRAIAAGRCSAQLYKGQWEDVGTDERLQALNG